jgi:DNA-binding MarR family transcriptional regulator
MRSATPTDDRVKKIVDALRVAGGWDETVEQVVCEEIDSAFDDGLYSASARSVRFRILRWISRHENQAGFSHRDIARHCGTTRETVTRHVSRFRHEGVIDTSQARYSAIGLTDRGRVFVDEIGGLETGLRDSLCDVSS